MKQPYLGKKVLELRKAKGLTQSELVEKCNITIRTLQRIESGEVTPRAYTIKAIFEVLNFDFYDSSKTKTNKSVRESNYMLYNLGQVYKYIIDLLNLKINTMKKLKILSVPVILVCIVLFTVSYNANAQRRIQKKLIGTWQVCNPDSTVAKDLYDAGDIARYKIITKETFMVSDFAPERKVVLNSFWGTYTVEKGVYTEFIQYTTPGFSNVFGVMNSFKVEIKKDFMFIKGTNNDLDEIWKKVKD